MARTQVTVSTPFLVALIKQVKMTGGDPYHLTLSNLATRRNVMPDWVVSANQFQVVLEGERVTTRDP